MRASHAIVVGSAIANNNIMNPEQQRPDPVEWPPLAEGPNEPGPTDQAGEYRASEQMSAGPNAGLAGKFVGARVPGEVRPTEQPIDIASQSKLPPRVEEDVLSPAEHDLDDRVTSPAGSPACLAPKDRARRA